MMKNLLAALSVLTLLITAFAVSPAEQLSAEKPLLAISSNRFGGSRLTTLDAAGENVTRLGTDEADASDPTWSPDGKRIVFASNRTGRFRIWVMNADGSDQRQVVDKDLYGWVYPAWSPDGKQIVFCDFLADQTGQVFVANADGQGVQQLTEGDGVNTFATWSPDNQYVAYLHFDKHPNMSPEGARLMIMDLVAGTRTQVSPGDMRCNGRPCWKPKKR